MMSGNNHSRNAGGDANNKNSPQPMPFHGVLGRGENWVSRNHRSDHLTSRCQARGLAGLERERGIPLQRHNLNTAFGAGDQGGAVRCAPDSSRNLRNSIRRH
jgi:hypothetical protein